MNNVEQQAEVHTASDSGKPMELYVFVDPLCPESWELQQVIRKLQIEYGHYFTVRTVLSTKLFTLNSFKKEPKVDTENLTHPVLASVAVKAAELQGKRAGNRFLHKLQEYLFLKTENVSSYIILLDIAAEAGLDIDEFKQDFHSVQAARSFQCDLSITREMEVDQVPSIVFFNECIEDEGVKVAGLYPYHVYEAIIEEMLDTHELERQDPPPIEKLFAKYSTLATREIASIYNIPEHIAERELKKYMLQQKLVRITLPEDTLWKIK